MKTAQELGIAEWERESLIFFMGKLANNTYQLDMNTSSFKKSDQPIASACGSVVCLGGNMFLKRVMDGGYAFFKKDDLGVMAITTLNDMMDSYVWNGGEHQSSALRELFFPHGLGHAADWSDIPSEIIAEGIKNFLNTGSPHWDSMDRSSIPTETRDWY